ncbi:MAG: ABC transporter permease [Saprospiraceae bacterium]|nr:ABC transporter permease [Saprospiraceae bacterium]
MNNPGILWMYYGKMAWRSLAKNRLISAINIGGFGISVAACLLIYAYVRQERNFDTFHTQGQHLYRLCERAHYPGQSPVLSPMVSHPMAPFLTEAAQGQIRQFARVAQAGYPIMPAAELRWGDASLRCDSFLCVDSSFFTIFDFPILAGDQTGMLRDQNSVVLTATSAKHLFGDQPALHQVVQLVNADTSYLLRVQGVLADFPANSHLQAGGLLPFPKIFPNNFHQPFELMLEGSYLQLRPGVDAQALQDQLDRASKTRNANLDIVLQPLAEVHLESREMVYDRLNFRPGNALYVQTFGWLGLILFLVACVNFINLTVVTAGERLREVGVKKSIGAQRAQIAGQFLAESGLAIGLALLLGLALSTFLLPWVNAGLSQSLVLDVWSDPALCLALLGLWAGAVVLAGVYPAVVVSGLPIQTALKNKLRLSSRRYSAAQILMIGQFAAAVFLIMLTAGVLQQLSFVRKADLGYSIDQVVAVPLSEVASRRIATLRSECSKIEGVEDVCSYAFRLGTSCTIGSFQYKDQQAKRQVATFTANWVAPHYLDFFNLQLQAGRAPQPEARNEYLVNEALVRKVGWGNPIGQTLHFAWAPEGRVVGVLKDFKFNTLHHTVEPIVLSQTGADDPAAELAIKLSSRHLPETLKALEARWNSLVPEEAFQYQFLDEHFAQLYADEQQAGAVSGMASLLAILIACLGLFGLIAKSIQHRTKEIGIRKVLGANLSSLVGLLTGDFLKLILFSSLLATPLAWYGLQQWLENFAFRIQIQWWLPVLASSLMLAIALLTIGFQSIRAALANPVNSLHNE